jgi:hypothetical protein
LGALSKAVAHISEAMSQRVPEKVRILRSRTPTVLIFLRLCSEALWRDSSLLGTKRGPHSDCHQGGNLGVLKPWWEVKLMVPGTELPLKRSLSPNGRVQRPRADVSARGRGAMAMRLASPRPRPSTLWSGGSLQRLVRRRPQSKRELNRAMGIILGTTLTHVDLERRTYAEQRRKDDAATAAAAQCTSDLWTATRLQRRRRWSGRRSKHLRTEPGDRCPVAQHFIDSRFRPRNSTYPRRQ